MIPVQDRIALFEKSTRLRKIAEKEFEVIGEHTDIEEIKNTASYLFEYIPKKYIDDNPKILNEIPAALNDCFRDIIEELKNQLGIITGTQGDNIYNLINQFIRFVNFICDLKYAKSKNPFIYKNLITNFNEIVLFIFSNKSHIHPYEKTWAQYFEQNGKDYEAFYLVGICELIRTSYNKKKHKAAFPRNFFTDFDFYHDFDVIISLYNLSLMAFLELIEAWIYIFDFMESEKLI